MRSAGPVELGRIGRAAMAGTHECNPRTARRRKRTSCADMTSEWATSNNRQCAMRNVALLGAGCWLVQGFSKGQARQGLAASTLLAAGESHRQSSHTAIRKHFSGFATRYMETGPHAKESQSPAQARSSRSPLAGLRHCRRGLIAIGDDSGSGSFETPATSWKRCGRVYAPSPLVPPLPSTQRGQFAALKSNWTNDRPAVADGALLPRHATEANEGSRSTNPRRTEDIVPVSVFSVFPLCPLLPALPVVIGSSIGVQYTPYDPDWWRGLVRFDLRRTTAFGWSITNGAAVRRLFHCLIGSSRKGGPGSDRRTLRLIAPGSRCVPATVYLCCNVGALFPASREANRLCQRINSALLWLSFGGVSQPCALCMMIPRSPLSSLMGLMRGDQREEAQQRDQGQAHSRTGQVNPVSCASRQ
ncbi:uncharacterized protein N7482_001600 [Penicillium canariense]|uniref:Uncharacterized protein n=1 Tax=Penicillium canariense TaxID=189055 RepID=A0A9W9IFF4_9EURO|nr:uncharacterized protein N7482_001600 [Penicillium canariense]KAJ5175723.1 hypothetical protein N7482_001600 [Penicillium canariense]